MEKTEQTTPAQELEEMIEEIFYGFDVDYNNDYVEDLLGTIVNKFQQKGIATYKSDIAKYIQKCIQTINNELQYDYTLFYQNLDLLQSEDINIKDILDIKTQFGTIMDDRIEHMKIS